jgi:microcystin-dependent protein
VRQDLANNFSDLASASSADLGSVASNYVRITGTTTITSFGTVSAGIWKFVRFAGALTLTHNSTSLILKHGLDHLTTAGDMFTFVSEGSGNWREVSRSTAGGEDVPGTIKADAGTSAPSGWLHCYGQAVSRTTYSAIFSRLSTTYGTGDGSSTFNLPDLRGRVVAGQDDMGGTSANRLTDQSGGLDGDTLGDTGGSETHTLQTTEIPAHTHGSVYVSGGGGIQGNVGTTGQIGSSGSTGGGGAHNNVQPTIILNYIIKT